MKGAGSHYRSTWLLPESDSSGFGEHSDGHVDEASFGAVHFGVTKEQLTLQSPVSVAEWVEGQQEGSFVIAIASWSAALLKDLSS